MKNNIDCILLFASYVYGYWVRRLSTEVKGDMLQGESAVLSVRRGHQRCRNTELNFLTRDHLHWESGRNLSGSFLWSSPTVIRFRQWLPITDVLWTENCGLEPCPYFSQTTYLKSFVTETVGRWPGGGALVCLPPPQFPSRVWPAHFFLAPSPPPFLLLTSLSLSVW